MKTQDVAIIGAGAAGLMAAIRAGQTAARRSVILLDGATVLGAKILVAGGGRCNVTHHAVDERAYAGSTPAAIRKVLRRFDVPETVAFFRDIGVRLKREETGKLFPTTDRARTVLDALLVAARSAGVQIRNPWRVTSVVRDADGFVLTSADGAVLRARRVVMATGGCSLPKTGSDGWGHAALRGLGHTVTPRVFPALVPLVVAEKHFVRSLAGITVPATLSLHAGTGRLLTRFTDSTLCTHFGVSGPGVLDISRYVIDLRFDDPGATLRINWCPSLSADDFDRALLDLGRTSPGRFLASRLPERLAHALCGTAGVDPGAPGHALTRVQRRGLVEAVTSHPLPVTGNRGYRSAEVTAGGVPLRELDLATMASRVVPGLHLCGEVCDVDGRIGGFNFQWAWASGHVAGLAVGGSVRADRPESR